MARCFLAVTLPEALQLVWKNEATHLGSGGGAIKWVEARQLHLTLAFLGELPDGLMQGVIMMLEALRRQWAPYALRLQGPLLMPSRGQPRIVVGSVQGAHLSRLHTQQQIICRGVQQLGIVMEQRPYWPHITLGRVKQAPRWECSVLKSRLARLSWWGSVLPIARVDFMQSDPLPQGAVYSRLATFALGGGGADSPQPGLCGIN